MIAWWWLIVAFVAGFVLALILIRGTINDVIGRALNW